MKIKLFHKTIFMLLLFSLFPTTRICCQDTKKKGFNAIQVALKRKRNIEGYRLGEMLNARNFDQALEYVDFLHVEYPNDPQFYFAEGWAYGMLGDSVRKYKAYTKSYEIYDSLFAQKPNFGDLINKAGIVQILYGMKAYDKALDEMLPSLKSPQDSLAIEQSWRKMVVEERELSF